MLNEFARENALADYMTRQDGGRQGLREGCELVMGLLGVYNDVVSNRSVFSENYTTYVAARAVIETAVTRQATN